MKPKPIWCTLAALVALPMFVAGRATTQESGPQIPEVAKPSPAAQDTRPIASDKKPNVVFILADNVGYGDLGWRR